MYRFLIFLTCAIHQISFIRTVAQIQQHMFQGMKSLGAKVYCSIVEAALLSAQVHMQE